MRSRTTACAYLAAAAFLFCASGVAAQAPATGARIRIVLPAEAAPPEQFAAEELVKYLAAMGNPAPGILHAPSEGELYIGTLPAGLAPADQRAVAALRDKDPDSFVLHSAGEKLIVWGNSPRANLYGAYHYLETLGVRWYFPGAENEVIPQARLRLSGYEIQQVPSFRKRGILPFNTTPGLRDLIDFAAKAKLNTVGIHIYPRFDPFFDANLPEAAKMIGPRGLTLDLERHFFGESFCPDDVQTLEQERKKLAAYLPQLPFSMKEYFLWAADKRLPLCASPDYKDYSQSDLVLWFSNQMAATIRQTRSDARFAFLGYSSTEAPPERVKPAPGVFLEWAPFNQSFGYAMDDPASTVNAEYRKNFEGQLKLFGAANTQILGYWLDEWVFYRGHSGALPYNPAALKGDLEYYHRLGVSAITTMGVYGSRDYFLSRVSPLAFLYPRLLWDVRSEPRDIVRAFCSDFFGDERLMQIFDLLAQADRMIYVERNRMVHAERATDGEFVATVAKALQIAYDHLESQTDPRYKARAARLLQEVASRFNTQVQPTVFR